MNLDAATMGHARSAQFILELMSPDRCRPSNIRSVPARSFSGTCSFACERMSLRHHTGGLALQNWAHVETMIFGREPHKAQVGASGPDHLLDRPVGAGEDFDERPFGRVKYARGLPGRMVVVILWGKATRRSVSLPILP